MWFLQIQVVKIYKSCFCDRFRDLFWHTKYKNLQLKRKNKSVCFDYKINNSSNYIKGYKTKNKELKWIDLFIGQEIAEQVADWLKFVTCFRINKWKADTWQNQSTWTLWKNQLTDVDHASANALLNLEWNCSSAFSSLRCRHKVSLKYSKWS